MHIAGIEQCFAALKMYQMMSGEFTYQIFDRLENHLWQLASKLDFVSYFVCICAFAHYPNSNFSLPPEYADLSVMQVIYGIVNDLKNWVIVKGDVQIQPLRVLGYGIFFWGT